MSGIFHYTSNIGAFGIIESKSIFATDYRYLNDVKELSIARDLLTPIFEDELRNEYRDLVASRAMKAGLERDYGPKIYREEGERLFDIAMRTTDRLTPIFITSFCRHEAGTPIAEHGLLSQWRGYGTDGGCALEFEEEGLKRIIDYERTTYAYVNLSFADVVYRNHVEAFDRLDLEGLAAAVLRHVANRTAESEAIYDDRLHALHGALAIIAPTLKTEAFHEEQEVRIIAPCMRKAAAEEFPERKVRKIWTRFKGGAPIPYLKLFDETQPLPIKRIIVGPQRDQRKVKYALEMALETADTDAEVVMSEISYLP